MESNEQTSEHMHAHGSLIPTFDLISIGGKKYSPWDYKEKQGLVIVFFDPAKSSDLEALSEINSRYHEITDENAEVLAVGSGPGEQLNECITCMNFKFPILSDVNGEAAVVYGATESMIYVADKFGELKLQAPVSGDLDATLVKVIDVLDLTELECPECGVSTWPES